MNKLKDLFARIPVKYRGGVVAICAIIAFCWWLYKTF